MPGSLSNLLIQVVCTWPDAVQVDEDGTAPTNSNMQTDNGEAMNDAAQ